MSVVKESPALYLWTITNKIKPQNDRPIWIETNNDIDSPPAVETEKSKNRSRWPKSEKVRYKS